MPHPMKTNLWKTFCIASLCLSFLPNSIQADALDRLTPEKLEAIHKAIERFQSERKEIQNPESPFKEYRANLHVHSAFSHDSRGKIEDIVSSAKKAGTDIILFTEHPAPKYDFFLDGHQGMKEGVLLIPGAETNGFLAFPRKSIKGLEASQKQEFSDIVRRTGGMTFLSHLEERLDWNIRDLTGVEIYNTHAMFKDQKKMASSLKNPFWIVKLEKSIRKYPQECFSALHEYPALYLKRFDELTQISPIVGISANDAHQNIGLKITMKEGNKASLESVLGEKFIDLDAGLLSSLITIPKDAKPGTEVFRMQLDSYETSLRHVGTHLLMKDLTVESVYDALEKRRAFVAFDWMANSKGFTFYWENGKDRGELGSVNSFQPKGKLQGKSPLAGHWKVIRNGKLIHEADGSTLSYQPEAPGVYRAELWLKVAEEDRIWILSNPIYLK